MAVLVRNLVLRLKDEPGFDCEVCIAHGRGVVSDEIESMGIPVHYLGMKNGLDFRRAWRIVSLIRKGKFDIVNYHGIVPLIRLMIIISGARNILEEQGAIKSEAMRGRSLNRWLHRLFEMGTDCTVAVSDDSINDLMNVNWVPRRKIVKIYNGIDISVFDPDKYERDDFRRETGIGVEYIVFGTVRGLTEKMGIDHFVEAAALVSQSVPGAKFLIVGDGPLRHQLEGLVSRLDLKDRFIFAGTRRDIPRILRSIDVFVLPSVWEALPVAAIEAVAMGIPVVAYDVGGTCEVVRDGITGILVRERNWRQLAEVMKRLAGNPAERVCLGTKGRDYAKEHFDIDKIALEFKRLYIRVAEGAKDFSH